MPDAFRTDARLVDRRYKVRSKSFCDFQRAVLETCSIGKLLFRVVGAPVFDLLYSAIYIQIERVI